MAKTAYYDRVHLISSIFMMLTLLWLTISLPVVNNFQLKSKTENSKGSRENKVPVNNNPFSNTTEEKAPSSQNLSEEYLHHSGLIVHSWFEQVNCYFHFSASEYQAFHSEVICPPPNA